MKMYAVLFLPDFRLQAALRHDREGAGRPLALLEITGTRQCIGELNAAARANHVQPGMTPTQACARCPELHFLTANAGHERSAQETLLQTAETLSPFLESTQPGVVTVALPDEKKFTLREFTDRVVTPLQRLGLETRIGVALTPDLAWLASKFANPVQQVERPDTFLSPLPVEALEPSQELISILNGWGIRAIGQLLALPRTQVCERLGPEAVKLWERATSGCPRPLKLVKPHEFFVERADLDHRIELLEPLLFLLRRFLEQITARLANGYWVAGKLRLVLRFEDGNPYQHTFTIPQPTREVDLLFRMLRTHLENFTSPASIVALELAAQPVRPHTEQFALLEKGLRDPHQFSETLARLQGLLGAERVGTPVLEPFRHPNAFHLQPYDAQAPAATELETPLIGIPWLCLRPPVPAKVILNEVRPAFLYSTRTTGPIKDVRGPWLSEGNWWEARRWARAEWDITTEEGMYRLVQAEDGWFLEGVYA